MKTGRPMKYHPDKPVGWRPLCLCGCGCRVRLRWHKYLVGHVPPHVYANNVRESRRRWSIRRRLAFFEEAFVILMRGATANGKLTKEAILDAFAAVHKRGYENGHQAGSRRWAERKNKAKAA